MVTALNLAVAQRSDLDPHPPRLEVETDALTTVLDEEAHDLLQPRTDAQGRLHFIRRPYEAPGGRRGGRCLRRA